MKYLVAFDICSDKRRKNIAKECLSVGFRVQESVFEIFLEASALSRFKERLVRKMNLDVDSVRIYPLDKFSDSGLEILGRGKRIESVNYAVL